MYNNIINRKFEANYKSQFNQDIIMYFKYFYNITNGFFVEIGAFDGVSISNTYLMEKNLNWRGILIEGGIKNCKKMYKNSKIRKNSYLVCTIRNNNHSPSIKCNTLSNITTFYNVKHIDFFSLDVEGSELEVIETFDFNVTVSHWLIEWPHLSKDTKNNIIYLLNKRGYKMKKDYISDIDVLFSHM